MFPHRLLLAPPVMLTLLTGSMAAQRSACPATDAAWADSLAGQYAPVLSFGPGERYFPTIPFFPAFDRTTGSSGFSASAQLREAQDEKGRISFDLLDRAYQRRVDSLHRHLAVHEPNTSAVFYRVRCLVGKQPKQLWGFLRNDHVALRRSGLEAMYEAGLRDAEFVVIEYYLYYVRDVGLQGHPHDIERVFVFVPYDLRGGVDTPERKAALGGGLRVIVGTGHSATTPNNVLVLVDSHVEEFTNPAFLIELGGHSSAPDLNRDNAFQVGLDINWNLSANVWGTRDLQAVAGRGFLGNYTSAMTFARSPCTATLLVPGSGAPPLTPAQRMGPAGAAQRGEGCAPLAAGAAEPPPVPYALVPVEPFAILFRQADRIGRTRTQGDTAQRIDSTRAAVESIRSALSNSGWRFGGFTDTSASAVLRALSGVANWRTVAQASHAEIWRHNDYTGSPIRVLKRRLYRPTFRGLQNVGDWASLLYGTYTVTSGGGVEALQAGVVVPAFGFLAVPGVLELQGGAAWGDRLFNQTGHMAVSGLYERHYRSLFSWYLRPLDFVYRRGTLEERTDGRRAEFAMSAGVSIMPFFTFPDLPILGPVLSNRLRVRLGMRADIAGWRPDLSRFEIQTILYAR